MLYRGLDRQALSAAYNNQAAVPDFAAQSAIRRHRSTELRRELGARVDLAYGAGDRQKLDLFSSSSAAAPLLVFIHGGYWQGGDKERHGFIAAGPVAHGFSVAVVEYTVAPGASLSAMVAEVSAAVSWLRRHATELNFDGSRLLLAGHSAGAQLVCTALDAPGVVGGIAISGIFDLEPIRLCHLNDQLGLTPEDVSRFSPIHHLPPADTHLKVVVGAAELSELVRQSRSFATVAARHGAHVQYSALPGHDHFSILEELASPEGLLCQHLVAMASGERGAKPPAQQ